MAIKKLAAHSVGSPVFKSRDFPTKKLATLKLSDLPSHHRAREAIAFALDLPTGEGNVFVVGPDRAGRMDSTREFLAEFYSARPKGEDWIYLYNFHKPNAPKPYRLPAGMGRMFKIRMAKMVSHIRELLPTLLKSREYLREVGSVNAAIQDHFEQDLSQLKYLAKVYRLGVDFTNDGAVDLVFIGDGDSDPAEFYQKLSEEERLQVQEGFEKLRPRTWRLTAKIQEAKEIASQKIQDIQKSMADHAFAHLFDDIERDFSNVPGLTRWLVTMRTDLMENLNLFMPEGDEAAFVPKSNVVLSGPTLPEERYSVNVLVDRTDDTGGPMVVVSNPTYENMFGAIKYKSTAGGYVTDFSLLKGGAIHEANGGVLVVRAEDLMRHDGVWDRLKACLRDKTITIDEPYRSGGIPLLDAPEPEGIPLDIRVVLVGSGYWFNLFFYNDASFKTYFRVKAEIDDRLSATLTSVSTYAALLQRFCSQRLAQSAEPDALQALLSFAARLTSDRTKLSAKVEILYAVASEASLLSKKSGSRVIREEDVEKALELRQKRDRHYEEMLLESFRDNSTKLHTHGRVVGQINGLTVLTMGQVQFGLPSRITASTYCGKAGIINIEKQTDMAGPIQQKGVYTLEGFLHHTFGQHFPVSFGCTLTFEQLYSEVDGDSASLAEVCCILSSLAEVPLRQDVALTGSIDQYGFVQVIGGVNEKIVGFYNVSKARGLKGSPGVLIPKENAKNVILPPPVLRDIGEGKFHIHTVEHIRDAMDFLTDVKFGSKDKNGSFGKETILGKAEGKLKKWFEISEQ